MAVDNLVERLVDAGLMVVRVGNPERVSERSMGVSLSHLVGQELADFHRKQTQRRAELRLDLRRAEARARRDTERGGELVRAIKSLLRRLPRDARRKVRCQTQTKP